MRFGVLTCFILVLFTIVSSDVRAAVEKPKLATVFIQKIKPTEIFDQLSFPARVSPQANSGVLSEIDGIVTEIRAPLGTAVKKGEKILVLRHTDPVYQYAPLRVTSPIEGVVSQVEVSPGAQVMRGQKLATVTDSKRVRILVEVPALDLASISAGMSAQFKYSGKDEWVPLRVKGVSPFVDPTTGTATCELEVADAGVGPKQLLAPGTIGQVQFKLNLRKGYVIPDYALVYQGAETFVRLIENGKSKKIAVRLGKRSRGSVEIVEGLREGAEVISRANRHIPDGEEVVVESTTDEVKL